MPKPATKTSAFLAALHDGCEGLLETRSIPTCKGDGAITRAFFAQDERPQSLAWCRERLKEAGRP